jgi:hypothetical protein
MKEEFKYGELVEVRQNNKQAWARRHYVGTMDNCAGYYTMLVNYNPSNYKGDVTHWKQIRKLQKPEPIEHWVGRIQTQVMSLMDRVGKIEDELRIKELNKPVKKLIKAINDGEL